LKTRVNIARSTAQLDVVAPSYKFGTAITVRTDRMPMTVMSSMTENPARLRMAFSSKEFLPMLFASSVPFKAFKKKDGFNIIY